MSDIERLVIETYKNELETDPELDEFGIFVSFLMTYGHSSEDIYKFAKNRGLVVDFFLNDEDDPDDNYGSIIITRKWYNSKIGGKAK